MTEHTHTATIGNLARGAAFYLTHTIVDGSGSVLTIPFFSAGPFAVGGTLPDGAVEVTAGSFVVPGAAPARILEPGTVVAIIVRPDRYHCRVCGSMDIELATWARQDPETGTLVSSGELAWSGETYGDGHCGGLTVTYCNACESEGRDGSGKGVVSG